MCSKENLTVFLLGINTVVLVSAVVLMLMGFVLLLNTSFITVYGSVVIGWGIGMLLSAILLAATGCMSFYGAQNHNKCMLLTSSVVAIVVIILQSILATSIEGTTAPDFSDELVTECLARGTSQFDSPECQAYYQDITTVRLFRLWMETYRQSTDDELVKQDLVAIEAENLCCGFGPAEQCRLGKYQAELEVTDALLESENPLPEVLGTCFQDRSLWYSPQHHCKIAVAPALTRGCPYVFSVSTSCLTAQTRGGCAKAYAEQVRSSILPIGNISLLLIIFQVLVCIASFCLCLRRKNHDVLPPPEAFVDRTYEKYRFEAETKLEPDEVQA